MREYSISDVGLSLFLTENKPEKYRVCEVVLVNHLSSELVTLTITVYCYPQEKINLDSDQFKAIRNERTKGNICDWMGGGAEEIT